MCYGTLPRGRTSVLPLLFIASVESIELFVIHRMYELSNKLQQTSICLERTSQILVLVFLPPNAPLMHAPRVNTIVFVGRMLRPLQISSPPVLDVFVIPSPIVAVSHCTKHISGQLKLAGYLIVRVAIHCKLLNELVEIGAIVIVLGFYHNFLCL